MTILALIVLLILLTGAAVFGFFYVQLQRNARRRSNPAGQLGSVATGVCSRCKQERLIVKADPGLCAACWSSINTKQIG